MIKCKAKNVKRIIAFTAANLKQNKRGIKVDTDSFPIGIDTHASYSMSNDKSHFIGQIKPMRQSSVIGVNS